MVLALWNALDGYKTYGAAIGLILVAIGTFLQGDSTILEVLTVLLNGLGLGALRMGVTKAIGLGSSQ